MILSMTAFARKEAQGAWGTLAWEIRSVNHRFLDIHPRLPEGWRELEGEVRRRMAAYLHRGKVECRLHYQPSPAFAPSIHLDMAFAQRLIEACRRVGALLPAPAPTDPLAVLAWPGVAAVEEADLAPVKEAALDLLDRALEELVATRHREGERLKALIQGRLEAMAGWLERIKARLPEARARVKERIEARLQELGAEVDEARLAQEVALWVQRMDAAEEVERLETHLQEAERVLEKGGVVGRRLDFLMQEMHREANTLAVKSGDIPLSQAALELKVLIEQVREQVQNIE